MQKAPLAIKLPLAALSGALLAAPFLDNSLSFVIFLALAPILVLCRGERPLRAGLLSFAGGLAFFLAGVFWLTTVTAAGWAGLSIYLALYFAAFGFCLGVIDKGSPKLAVLAIPALFAVLEYLRGVLLTGFPWLFLGHALSQWPLLIQTADLGGVPLLSFAVVSVNLLASLAIARDWKRLRFGAAASGLLTCAALAYGAVRMSGVALVEGPAVAIVQGNIPLSVHDDRVSDEERFAIYKKLTAETVTPGASIVLWPETELPGVLNIEEKWMREVAEVARSTGAHCLFGGVAKRRAEDEKQFNSAYYFAPSGVLLARHDKIHLVPFGEFVPLENVFPLLEALRPPDKKPFIAGDPSQGLLDYKGLKFGVSICFEDAFADIARRDVLRGADFLVNLSNDAWFKDSAELWQHSDIAVFRAVETRRPLVRSTNTGISSVVDPLGRQAVLRDKSGKAVCVKGVLRGTVMLAKGSPVTVYSRLGDAFALLCAAAAGAAVLLGAFRRNPA